MKDRVSMNASVVRVALLQIYLLFTFSALSVSGVEKLTVSPDRDSAVVFSNQVRGSACVVCVDQGRSQQCGPSVRLNDTGAASLEFTCSRPQDVFSVDIIKDIECTAKLCDGGIVLIESPGTLPLSDFDRTFTWNLMSDPAFRIDFTKTGLRQIEPSSGSCPDQHTYTLEAFQPSGQQVAVGTYCRDGAVRGAQVQNQGRFSLKVPAKQKLQAALFPVSVGEKIKSLARVQVVLPEGTSSSELLSPNYPDSVPDGAVMEWDFWVAPKHTAAVLFVNDTQPRCRKSRERAAMEYRAAGRAGATALEPAARQATQIRGNFSLTLSNCDMDRKRGGGADSPGLSVHFQVSALRTSFPVQCSVDLRMKKGLSLNIEKTTAGSDCEMQMDSAPRGKISVPAGQRARLSFQDCYPEDLLVVARQIIECPELRGCSSPFALTVPDLRSCPPAPLSSMTWTLRPPPHGTVEMWPPASTGGGLRQSLPDQRCNDSAILNISEGDGTSVGRFCPQGPVQKMQINNNVSVVVSRSGSKELVASQSLLNARFRDQIFERYIFTVSPKKGAATRLATPGWPAGMKPYSTVAWIVSVPAKMEASIRFANASRPKCGNRHTNIGVRGLSSPEEIYSRREDEATSDVLVYETFYLNMSNCMPESGQFSVISQITLQKNKNLILTIVLSVVAVLCVLTIAILGVVCVVIRKKKKKLNHQVSVYNPNGASFLPGGAGPGTNGFPKSREDNESHVYASIEDDLVYTHLLRKGDEDMEVYGEVDTYQAFTGPTATTAAAVADPPPPPGPPPSATGTAADAEHAANVGVYQPYVAAQQSQQAPPPPPPLPNRPASHGPAMVDNELYGTEMDGDPDGSSSHHSEEEEAVVGRGPRLDPEGGD